MNFAFFIIFFIIFVTPLSALAAPPNAGQILQEQQQNQKQLQPASQVQVKSQANQAPEAKQGPRIVVKGFRFVGDIRILNEQSLQHVVRDYVGRDLSFGELQQAADSVSRYLRHKGYAFGRAYLPAQQVQDGMVEITILLGKARKEDIAINGTKLRISEDRLHQTLAQALLDQSGPYLKMQDLQRGLLLINSLPGTSAQADLQPGPVPDSTRIITHVTEAPLVTGNVSTDNFGDRYTGTERYNSEVDINDPFHYGDEISLQTTAAEHLAIEKALYSLPVGYSGLRLNTSFTDLLYSIGKEFSSLDAHGLAETADVNAGYPFILTEKASLYGTLAYDYKVLRDFSQDITTDNKRDNVETIGLNGSTRDDVCGGGLNSYNLAVAFGDLNLTASAVDLSTDASGPGTAGDYTKFTYNVARLQHVLGNWSFFAALNGQVSDKDLDSSEKFILGGPTGVRAYPMGEATGDEGWVTNLELRYDFPWMTKLGNLQGVGFYDAGHVTLYRNTWDGWNAGNSSLPNHYALSGAGVGLNLFKGKNYAVRVSYAWPIGPNPAVNAQGLESDGKHRSGRLWLQFMVYF